VVFEACLALPELLCISDLAGEMSADIRQDKPLGLLVRTKNKIELQ
jgi:hypothetical protein